jgi:hypothetical protein
MASESVKGKRDRVGRTWKIPGPAFLTNQTIHTHLPSQEKLGDGHGETRGEAGSQTRSGAEGVVTMLGRQQDEGSLSDVRFYTSSPTHMNQMTLEKGTSDTGKGGHRRHTTFLFERCIPQAHTNHTL